MKSLIMGVGLALVLVAGPALAQPTKSVSGSITTIGANSVTVTAGGKEMTFAVDGKTQVITPGGSTRSRAAKAEGKPGPAITDLLKAGQAVEVRYHEEGMHAASIRPIASVPGPRALNASGTVTALSENSLTVKGASADWTFVVDSKTTVVGTGVGTASKKMETEGKKAGLTDLVHEGDTVTVTYHDMDSTKHASVVRITRRKM